ncbi:MAG TPA: RusA family crossover junction endodeoxyribonuclease [Acetobacteraceae bacterium]|nr:RusA family crossover junction endodeoxyribonuclease [Acetobacteraceae bacterium]
MSERFDPDISLAFPVEFLIKDTPRSQRSDSAKKELWKRKVGEIASAHVKTLRELPFLDDRPLAATIFYFPAAEMQGDVDNIVKPILDGMIKVIYPDDRFLERIIVQKFEPGVEVIFRSLTPTLEQALEIDPPVIYIRIDDDLSWREVQ